MSIKADIQELNQLNTEIKRLSLQIKNLRKSSKAVESRIIEYLQFKEQPGVKYDNNKIIVENKIKRIPKRTAEREQDALKILSEYGIENPKRVLDELLEARKGEEEEIKKLKIKKIK